MICYVLFVVVVVVALPLVLIDCFGILASLGGATDRKSRLTIAAEPCDLHSESVRFCCLGKCRFGAGGNVAKEAPKSESSRRLWLFPGSGRGFSRKTPGSQNAFNSRIWGIEKGKPAANRGSTLRGPCPNLLCIACCGGN